MRGRDREGGGDSALRVKLFQRVESGNSNSRNGVGSTSNWKQPLCLLYPLPVPPPHWGEGTLWHRSSHLPRCMCVHVSTCVHAPARKGTSLMSVELDRKSTRLNSSHLG